MANGRRLSAGERRDQAGAADGRGPCRGGGAAHGEPAARDQRPVHDHHGHQDAFHRPRLKRSAMSSTDPRGITLSPGLVSTSSDEVERVLSALLARREPLAALLAGGADSRWKLRLVDPMRQYIVVAPLSGGSAIAALLDRQQVTFVAEFGGMHIHVPTSDPVA